ncbi:MAG: hypothetical protein K2L15_04925 [Eubacteriales bacterium]|nr:hypothetical protein [Eubacteriales bacterium]
MARFLAFNPRNHIQDVINIDKLISYKIKYFDSSSTYCGIITFTFSNNTEFIKRCETYKEMNEIISVFEKYSIEI